MPGTFHSGYVDRKISVMLGMKIGRFSCEACKIRFHAENVESPNFMLSMKYLSGHTQSFLWSRGTYLQR